MNLSLRERLAQAQVALEDVFRGLEAMQEAGEDPFELVGVDTRLVLQMLAAKGRETSGMESRERGLPGLRVLPPSGRAG